MIYWVRAGDTQLTKVGFAVDVAKRLPLLQTGCPYPLSLLRQEPGTRDLEAALHRHYRPKRVRAEWFALDAADIAVSLADVDVRPVQPIQRVRFRPRPADVRPGQPAPSHPMPPNPVAQFDPLAAEFAIDAAGGNATLAAYLGWAEAEVVRMRRIGIPMDCFQRVADAMAFHKSSRARDTRLPTATQQQTQP